MNVEQQTTTEHGGSDWRTSRRVLLSSLAGSTVEWYEFFIYGAASALVFSKVFFPQLDPLLGTLFSLSTFAVAFIFRPIGAAVFGHFGDRIGRKSTLVITLTMMGLATFFIGILPTYDSVGVMAPILLVVLRIFQGLSLGGEYTGAVLMCVEHAGPKRRGLFGAIVNSGLPLGLILSNLVFIGITAATGPEFLTWGWRIPFIASLVLVGIGLAMRLKVAESPEFKLASSENHPDRAPIIETFKAHKKPVLLAALAYVSAGVTFYLGTVFSLSYAANHLKLDNTTILTVVLIAFVLNAVLMPFFGWLSDRWNRRKIFIVSALVMAVVPFVWFALLETRSFPVMVLGYFLLILPFSANYGVMPTYFAECFPPMVRYTGMAVGYTLGTIISSAIAPIVATSLFAATGGWIAIAIYMTASALISAFAAVFLFESREPLRTVLADPEDEIVRATP